jgi:hypothetical protein
MSKTIIFTSIITTSLLIMGYSNTNSFVNSIGYETEIIPTNNFHEDLQKKI